ncbi:MAG: patatin-like phospholipase family protein [Actinomycetes bacterium]
MTTAFVLSGGGSLGAVQVGMLAALAERNVAPDLLVGTSVGALNATFVAQRGTDEDAVRDLRQVWLRLRRRDVFPFEPRRQLLALAGRRPSLCSADGLRRILEDNLPYRHLEDALVPVHVLATNVLTGEEVFLSSGEVVPVVLASAAIPGVFPAVVHEGLALCDGGVSDNAGISRAVALGADTVYVLPAGYACALTRPPSGAVAAALHAVSLLTHRRLLEEVASFADRVDLRVLPPLCPLSVSPFDFGHTRELVGRAFRSTSEWLATGASVLPHPERFLGLHDHESPTPVERPSGGTAQRSPEAVRAGSRGAGRDWSP